MDLIYLAHPVRPLEGSTETVDSNLDDVEWWLRELQRANPEVAIIAPWIACLRLGVDSDADEQKRVQGLARASAACERCNGIILCGPRISGGMLTEIESVGCGRHRHFPVVHRFSDRRQDLVLPPRHHWMACDLDVTVPAWMERVLYGAVPQSAELVGAEILDALDGGFRMRCGGVAAPRLPLVIDPGSMP